VLATLLVIACAGAACVAWGILFERRWYRVRTYRLNILPTDAPAALTVLHLSDLHLVRNDPGKTRFLAGLPQPDLCVVTGDFLAEPAAAESAAQALRPVRGKLASWFVLGSNDYFAARPINPFRYFRRKRKPRRAPRGRSRELVAALEADGWEHLRNMRKDVRLDGAQIEVLGLDDAHIGWHDIRAIPRRSPGRFGFAVMHSPDSAPESAACGWNLIVAGHTHGGQVRLPLIGALVTNSTMPRRLASGLIRIDGALMHLSKGLGTSKYAPFRFWCRPEATILELRRAAADPR
jgi:uncharacterized protein